MIHDSRMAFRSPCKYGILLQAGCYIIVSDTRLSPLIIDMIAASPDIGTKSRGALRTRLPPWLKYFHEQRHVIHRWVQKDAGWLFLLRCTRILRIG
jgi:hypothetical protein